MNPVKLIIIGAGIRGTDFAAYGKRHPEQVKIVGVAEPRKYHRQRLVAQHQIPPQHVFADWRELVDKNKLADAVYIATQDATHAEAAIACANNGYHILLEKPMATNERDCRKIVDAVVTNRIIIAVCHVMRYTRYTQKMKSIVDAGLIGDIVTIQHLEPVGYWHQAHSFVRGNWRNEKESAFMLLSKSCHDLDWLHYIIGKRCKSVSSFGSLKHFRKHQQPANASDRCLDCDYEPNCPYSAKKIYLGRFKRGVTGWPVDVLTPEVSRENILEALWHGPYGRCVYTCDNDVVDHQVVNLLFDDDVTATFTMTAFTKADHRKTHIFGSKGELFGDGRSIRQFDFLTDKTQVIEPEIPQYPVLRGHSGGDFELMKSFITAVAENDPNKVLSGPEETLESHLMVFAAERSRRENIVVDL